MGPAASRLARHAATGTVCAIFALASSTSDTAVGASSASSPGTLQPAAGRLLVATPQLVDPNFAHTVVLVTHHDSQGTLGVIVNWPSDHLLREAVPWVGDFEERDDRLYIGGPVDPERVVLLLRRSREPPKSERVLDDVWVSGSPETLRDAMVRRVDESDLRAMAGYAGWAAGQLEAELSRGDWYVVRGRPELVFDASPQTLWEALVKRARLPVA